MIDISAALQMAAERQKIQQEMNKGNDDNEGGIAGILKKLQLQGAVPGAGAGAEGASGGAGASLGSGAGAGAGSSLPALLV